MSRAVAQFGSASGWGSEGRRFNSCQPDSFPPRDLSPDCEGISCFRWRLPSLEEAQTPSMGRIPGVDLKTPRDLDYLCSPHLRWDIFTRIASAVITGGWFNVGNVGIQISQDCAGERCGNICTQIHNDDPS